MTVMRTAGENATLEGCISVRPAANAVTRKVASASVRGCAKYEKLADTSGRERPTTTENVSASADLWSLFSKLPNIEFDSLLAIM